MSNRGEPEIVSADLFEDGLVIIFADGRSAFYSAGLLSSVYPEADNLEAFEAGIASNADVARD